MKFFQKNLNLAWIITLGFSFFNIINYSLAFFQPATPENFILIIILSFGPLALVIWLSQFTSRLFLKILSGILVFWYILDSFAAIYKLVTHYSFNIYYFSYNLSEALPTLTKSFSSFWPIIILLLLLSWVFYQAMVVAALNFKNKDKQFLNAFIFLIILLNIISYGFTTNRSELANVIRDSWKINTATAKLYDQYYWQIIDKNSRYNQAVLTDDLASPSQNIFFIHLESLNSNLVSEKITPKFLNTVQAGGILFPNLQTSNIQTIRSEENILCPILPSIRKKLYDYDVAEELVCLPKMMKSLGYKTLFFKSHDLGFSDTGDFMLSLGFDEIHNGDIMRPEDKKLTWGYREDVFYQRVFEYLQRYQDEKIFVYIAVSTTNHLPFVTIDNDYQDVDYLLPFKQQGDPMEIISDSTFLQDYFFGQMFADWQAEWQDNSHMLIFGDQAWPTGEHDNYYNQENAFQENFLSSLAIVPATNKTIRAEENKFNQSYVSQTDILPTTLDLLGVGQFKAAGQSLLGEVNPAKCIISVQPYSRTYLSVLRYPLKYIYNILDNQVTVYDLANDPQEKNPLSREPIEDLDFLESCLQEIVDN